MSAIYDLEIYFAKHYTKKYCELGGSYYASGDSSSPLEDYFESGEYKELQDEALERLYQKVSESNYNSQAIRIGLFGILLIAYYFF
jgi:hypothetical protein